MDPQLTGCHRNDLFATHRNESLCFLWSERQANIFVTHSVIRVLVHNAGKDDNRPNQTRHAPELLSLVLLEVLLALLQDEIWRPNNSNSR
jgi:hypothetical protein